VLFTDFVLMPLNIKSCKFYVVQVFVTGCICAVLVVYVLQAICEYDSTRYVCWAFMSEFTLIGQFNTLQCMSTSVAG